MASSARVAQRPAYGGSGGVLANGSYDGLDRLFAIGAFTVLLFSTIALNAFKIGGIPVRSVAAIGVLGLAFLFYFDLALAVLRRHALLLTLMAALAMLGVFVSFVNGTPIGLIIFTVAEVHVQAAVLFLLATICAHVAGARACALAFVGVVGVSTLFAFAQMLDIHAAWAARRAFGPFPNEAIEGVSFVGRRPSGLSYSPIQLSTHLCLAFAVFLAVREKFRRGTEAARTADPLVMPALAVLFGACIATATRSPILGGCVFVVIYAMQRRTSWLPLFLILLGVLVYMAWPMLMGVVETYAPRVARTDDDSASARYTLIYYGTQLFLDNPLGYGLKFEPMNYWSSYWPAVYLMPAPEGVQIRDLHNYVLTMLNTYGVGLLLVLPIALKLLFRAGVSLIFFVPYAVHVFFHNSGPFANDTVIWFVIAAIVAAGREAADPASRPMVRKKYPVRSRRLHPAAAQYMASRALRPR